MSLTVESTRFGTLEIKPEAVLSFPRGLIGLGGSRYALLSTDPDSPFSWLHSVEDPDLALPVTRPWEFFPNYEVMLGDAEAAALGLAVDAAADVWVTVRATERVEDFTVNLRAPIVVAPGADGPEAYQIINEAPDADVRAPLFAPGA
ncbi:MAG: flagellar assembly factor FliW [Solirubrobacteraceae bacterium]|jgi:flagellar assembly factor FliW|nr:flagellar assembly factor FliW [Solirubrobacteraceae bacterium]MEA2240554.1 flagellar assembly factor FliW [Solirubrobacteraceae bacterium]